jgi:hypothetical protein
VSCSSRLKIFLRNIGSLLYTKVVTLNLSRPRDFGSSIDPERYQQLGQWATRLYALCLLCSFFLILTYRIIKPVMLTKTFTKPSFQRYHSLKGQYEDQLKCTCLSFATPYDRFLEIQFTFHQVI